MSGLAEQLHRLYTAEVYPVLAQSDPRYKASLEKAGLGWHARTVPQDKRASFEDEMRLQATFAAKKVEEARSLAPGTIRAKLLAGPATLYRVSQRRSTASVGIWWFTEKVAKRCRTEAGNDSAKQLEWLRNVLAVSFNFSTFDRLERFALRGGERIPAVTGRGLPMPHYKVAPYRDAKTGESRINLPKDYWQRKGQMLLGGEQQVLLPWIPVTRVVTTKQL